MQTFREYEAWSELCQLDEVQKVIRVDSTGERHVKFKCKPGFIFNGDQCVSISGSELFAMRKQARLAARTKKAKGKGYWQRIARKRKKAMKRREQMGNVLTQKRGHK